MPLTAPRATRAPSWPCGATPSSVLLYLWFVVVAFYFLFRVFIIVLCTQHSRVSAGPFRSRKKQGQEIPLRSGAPPSAPK